MLLPAAGELLLMQVRQTGPFIRGDIDLSAKQKHTQENLIYPE